MADKQDKLSAGDGLTLDGDTLSVTTPVKSMTKAEFDNLLEDQKDANEFRIVNTSGDLSAYFGASPVFGPRGPAGPDGNPIGTIISYMGLTAPKDYLICDGTVFEIADYPKLADFFEEQFGSKDHFGGDGETTFAVPDMRNLFLRGYHGEAEEQLSGDVGMKQEATEHVFFNFDNENKISTRGSLISRIPGNIDARVGTETFDSMSSDPLISTQSGTKKTSYYTARPVNMAVLYCIKAVESLPTENVYSTEETQIGTWIDGKPLYRKVFNVGIPGKKDIVINISDLPKDTVTNCYVFLSTFGLNTENLYISCSSYNNLNLYIISNEIHIDLGQESRINKPTYVVIEYTKSTDQATIELPAMFSSTPIAVTAAQASATTKKFNIGSEEV